MCQLKKVVHVCLTGDGLPVTHHTQQTNTNGLCFTGGNRNGHQVRFQSDVSVTDGFTYTHTASHIPTINTPRSLTSEKGCGWRRPVSAHSDISTHTDAAPVVNTPAGKVFIQRWKCQMIRSFVLFSQVTDNVFARVVIPQFRNPASERRRVSLLSLWWLKSSRWKRPARSRLSGAHWSVMILRSVFEGNPFKNTDVHLHSIVRPEISSSEHLPCQPVAQCR